MVQEEAVTRTTWSREDVDAYMKREFGGQLNWYEEQSAVLEKKVTTWTLIGIWAGVTATVLAAFPTSLLESWTGTTEPPLVELIRWGVVVTSAVAATANGTLVPKYRRAAMMREKGRVKTTLHAKLAEITLLGKPMSSDERLEWLSSSARGLMSIEDEHGGAIHGSSPSDERPGSS